MLAARTAVGINDQVTADLGNDLIDSRHNFCAVVGSYFWHYHSNDVGAVTAHAASCQAGNETELADDLLNLFHRLFRNIIFLVQDAGYRGYRNTGRSGYVLDCDVLSNTSHGFSGGKTVPVLFPVLFPVSFPLLLHSFPESQQATEKNK